MKLIKTKKLKTNNNILLTNEAIAADISTL